MCRRLGIDFRPYVQFVGPSGLDLPLAVMTDGDPTVALETDGEDKADNCHYAGLKRGIDLAKLIDNAQTTSLETDCRTRKWEDVRKALAKIGIFVNRQTLEDELLTVGYGPQFVEIYRELGGTPTQQRNMSAEIDRKEIDKVIRRIETTGMGKGRFAQRLAEKIVWNKVPSYIDEAINFVLQIVPGLPIDKVTDREVSTPSAAHTDVTV